MATLDEQIGRAVEASLRSGGLRAAPSWGRPMADDDGFDTVVADAVVFMPENLVRPYRHEHRHCGGDCGTRKGGGN